MPLLSTPADPDALLTEVQAADILNLSIRTLPAWRVRRAGPVFDHVEGHHGDYEKFWDRDNWQALCKRHHDSTKQREENDRRRGDGGQKVRGRSFGTGAPAKLLRPRNSTGGSND
jgi:hypothetical protein